MQNMQNIQKIQDNQNQYINLNEYYLEDLIRPYKEKIEKLESELKEKQKEIDKLKLKLFQNNVVNKNKQQFVNNIGNQINNQMINGQLNNMNQMDMMNNMGIQMNKMNNNINLMNNQMNQNNMMNMPNISNNNNLINNPMFQMCNLMNANNNAFQMMQTGNNINKKEIKNLKVIFRMNNVAPVMIQCQSDDKMYETINKFRTKVGLNNIEKYKFIFDAKNIKLNATVEENGITNDSNIFVVKTSQIKIAKEKETKKNNQNINNNSSMLEEEWTLFFETNYGSKVAIKIGKFKLVKEAQSKFCLKLNISYSTLKYMKFIYHSKELCPDMKICQSGLENESTITVIETHNITGA